MLYTHKSLTFTGTITMMERVGISCTPVHGELGSVQGDLKGCGKIFEWAPHSLIVTVNSRFLQHPQKRSRGTSLFTGAYPKLTCKLDSQQVRSKESGRQTIRQLWWMVFGVETGGRQGGEDESG